MPLARTAMATRFEAVLVGRDAAQLRAAGERALEEVAVWEDLLSPYLHGSWISRLNQGAEVAPVAVPAEVFGFLIRCMALWRETDGAFDPTVGPLMEAWGLRGGPESGGETRAFAAASVGMEGVILDAAARTVTFTRPGMALDVGAVAKGWALDCAAETIRESGAATGFLLHGGTSTVIAAGRDEEDLPWRVGVASPADPEAVQGTVELVDRALSVSAPHGRVSETGHPHVMDPRSGRPAVACPLAVVTAHDATTADAHSTALLVAGGDQPARLDLA